MAVYHSSDNYNGQTHICLLFSGVQFRIKSLWTTFEFVENRQQPQRFSLVAASHCQILAVRYYILYYKLPSPLRLGCCLYSNERNGPQLRKPLVATVTKSFENNRHRRRRGPNQRTNDRPPDWPHCRHYEGKTAAKVTKAARTFSIERCSRRIIK